MAGHYSDLVCIVEGEMGVYENEEIGYGFREREGLGEKCPGMRICVENKDQKRWRSSCSRVSNCNRESDTHSDLQ